MNKQVKVFEARIDQAAMEMEGMGEMHSVFRSALNIRFSGVLMTVLPRGITGVPDGLVIEKNSFDKLKEIKTRSIVKKEKGRIVFVESGISLVFDKKCAKNSRFDRREIKIDKDRINLFFAAVNEYRGKSKKENGLQQMHGTQYLDLCKQLYDLCRSIIDSKEKKTQGIIRSYCGMGLGLTPSFDDAVVGMLAVCNRLFRALCGRECVFDVGEYAEIIGDRTTDISKKYLMCALDGRFSDLLISMVNAIFFDKKDVYHAIEEMGRVGATSGMDMLLGIETALKCFDSEVGYEAV